MDFKQKEVRVNFYKRNKDWLRVRQDVLERDNYECQECKRQGNVFTDKHNPDKHKRLDVDHIKDLEDCTYEEAIDMDNLEALCIKCHNRKHNRFQGWKRKKPKWDDEMW
ncbi:HNH endonuclease [Cytobacillus sp. FSL R5-0569]|uniref:HNH endonuclease n=1 Tax=Cytobacillus sp. FSL R5-0569 TaxID=2921649 RepID=UPI0030FB9DA6